MYVQIFIWRYIYVRSTKPILLTFKFPRSNVLLLQGLRHMSILILLY